MPFLLRIWENEAQRGAISLTLTLNDRMAERVTTVRQGASLRVFNGRLPFVYPIFHPLMSRETE